MSRYGEYNINDRVDVRDSDKLKDFMMRTIVHNKQKKNKKSKVQIATLTAKQHEYMTNANKSFDWWKKRIGAMEQYTLGKRRVRTWP